MDLILPLALSIASIKFTHRVPRPREIQRGRMVESAVELPLAKQNQMSICFCRPRTRRTSQ
jgi:hypothetical protein